MKKKLFLLLTACTFGACHSPEEDVEDPANIITSYEIDAHGFMPIGPTLVSGIFECDSVCESMMMIASEIYTYHYADGHSEVEDHGTFIDYTIDGVGQVFIDSVCYASDSMSVFGNGEYDPVDDSLAYTANIVVELKENHAPVSAICYVAHNGTWATLRWKREEPTTPGYWESPQRFALPRKKKGSMLSNGPTCIEINPINNKEEQ